MTRHVAMFRVRACGCHVDAGQACNEPAVYLLIDADSTEAFGLLWACAHHGPQLAERTGLNLTAELSRHELGTGSRL